MTGFFQTHIFVIYNEQKLGVVELVCLVGGLFEVGVYSRLGLLMGAWF